VFCVDSTEMVCSMCEGSLLSKFTEIYMSSQHKSNNRTEACSKACMHA